MHVINEPQRPSSATFAQATRVDACPVCGAPKGEVYIDYNGFEITRCQGCELVYTNPVPSEEELRDFYSKYAGETGTTYVPYRSITRRLKYAAFAWFIKRFFPADKKIRMLEIGCSQGDLLSAVRKDPRFEALGIDYAVNSVNHARSLGLNAEVTDLFSKQFPDGSFDLVVSIHVIEHVRDPRAWLAEIRRVLAKDGVVFLVTPCVTHPKARWSGKNWKYWGPPGHLWYFSPKSLSSLATRVGFKPLLASCLYHRAHVRFAARKSD